MIGAAGEQDALESAARLAGGRFAFVSHGYPRGYYLAIGYKLEDAKGVAGSKNWRFHVIIPLLREQRLERGPRSRLRDRLEYAFRELVKQRARMRRNRGKQIEMDFETTEALKNDPNYLTASPGNDNPRHSSESFEHGSPPRVVQAAWEVMGVIDLDPASSEKFNEVVEARSFFDKAANGLKQAWRGNIFLNPPGGLVDGAGRSVFVKTKNRVGCSSSGACGLPPGHKHQAVTSSAKAWWYKLASEWDLGRVEQAIFIGFSLEILQTTQADQIDGLPTPLDFPICVPSQRIKYLSADEDGRLTPGEDPTHASFFAYIGPNVVAFRKVFAQFGKVVG